MRWKCGFGIFFVVLLFTSCNGKSGGTSNNEDVDNKAILAEIDLLLRNLDDKNKYGDLPVAELALYLKENGATKITYSDDAIWFRYQGIRGVYAFEEIESGYETIQMPLFADVETTQFALTPIGSGNVGIFSAFFQNSGDVLEKMFLENNIDVTNHYSLSLSDIRDFKDYQLIIVNTHGGIAFDEFYFFTSETITTTTDVADDFAKDSLGVGMTKGTSDTRLIIFPKYFDVANIDFQDDSILYFNACQSLANETLASKLYNDHNLGVFVGWTNEVQNGYSTFTNHVFFAYLLEGLSVADAVYNGEGLGSAYCDEAAEAACEMYDYNLEYHEECLDIFSKFCDFGEHTEQTEKGVEYKTKLDYIPKNAGNLVFVKEFVEETSGEVGDPCESDNDCISEMCQYSLDDSLPGGYCVASCSTAVNCPYNAWCIFHAAKDGICYKQCNVDIDCLDGYYCQEVDDGTGERVCWPGGWLEEFQPENAICGELYHGMPPFQCQKGLICGKIAEDWNKDDVCQRLCTKSADCKVDSTCAPVQIKNSGENSFCGVCQKYNASATIGDLCCSNQDCPVNSRCISYSDGNGYCSQICTLGSTGACKTGLTCWEIEGLCQDKGICAP